MTDHPDSTMASALRECEAYFEERADAEYFTDSPTPSGNEEERLLISVQAALRTPDPRLANSEMVERVARAMADAAFIECSTEIGRVSWQLFDGDWQLLARAAIAAITEGKS